MTATVLTTSDTDFASALMSKGARLVSWEPSTDQPRHRMFWTLEGIEPQWIEQYRTGADGISAFMHARKMLVNIVKTDNRLSDHKTNRR